MILQLKEVRDSVRKCPSEVIGKLTQVFTSDQPGHIESVDQVKRGWDVRNITQFPVIIAGAESSKLLKIQTDRIGATNMSMEILKCKGGGGAPSILLTFLISHTFMYVLWHMIMILFPFRVCTLLLTLMCSSVICHLWKISGTTALKVSFNFYWNSGKSRWG